MKKLLMMTLVAAAGMGSLGVQAYEQGDMLVRVGATTVDPVHDFEPDGISANDNTQLGLNFAYMVAPNVGVELLAATPFKHDIETRAGKIGTTKHLPPTLSVQYYFDNASQVTPYVGAGLNYTIFFGEKVDGVGDIELKNSFGLALQAGIDMAINEQYGVNVDLRKIDIATEVESPDLIKGTEVDVDPMVYSITGYYKF